LSDRVRVQVSRVDLDARKIDFRLVRDMPVKSQSHRASAMEKASDLGGPRVRSIERAPQPDGARRKKAPPAQTAAVKEARAARKAGASKKRPASKSAAKQAHKKR
jgi:ribonuclease R